MLNEETRVCMMLRNQAVDGRELMVLVCPSGMHSHNSTPSRAVLVKLESPVAAEDIDFWPHGHSTASLKWQA